MSERITYSKALTTIAVASTGYALFKIIPVETTFAIIAIHTTRFILYAGGTYDRDLVPGGLLSLVERYVGAIEAGSCIAAIHSMSMRKF